jgi:hypothetical protein
MNASHASAIEVRSNALRHAVIIRRPGGREQIGVSAREKSLSKRDSAMDLEEIRRIDCNVRKRLMRNWLWSFFGCMTICARGFTNPAFPRSGIFAIFVVEM